MLFINNAQLDCCGAQEYLDWSNVTFSMEGKNVPDSCCLSDISGCGKDILTLSRDEAAMKIHTGGCLDIFTTSIQENVGLVGGVGIGIGFLQVNVITNIVFRTVSVLASWNDLCLLFG